MKYYVSNFYFPLGHSKLKIGNYVFEKLENPIEKKTGHTITSKVYISKKELYSKIGQHPIKASTELDDICLILSLFTGHDVFYTKKESIDKLYADPRFFNLSNLGLSLNVYFKERDGNLFMEGFENEINKIMRLIRRKSWLKSYKNGAHLFMLKEAMKYHSRDLAFISYWIIWEHLFYIFNKKWLSELSSKKISARDKISFILTHFEFFTTITKQENEKLQDLADIRNHIIHFGYSPNFTSYPKEYWMFFILTQFVVLKTLKLIPKDMFNTLKEFETFIKQRRNKKYIRKLFE